MFPYFRQMLRILIGSHDVARLAACVWCVCVCSFTEISLLGEKEELVCSGNCTFIPFEFVSVLEIKFVLYCLLFMETIQLYV